MLYTSLITRERKIKLFIIWSYDIGCDGLADRNITDTVLKKTADNSGSCSKDRERGAGRREGVIWKIRKFDWKKEVLSEIDIPHLHKIQENMLNNAEKKKKSK